MAQARGGFFGKIFSGLGKVFGPIVSGIGNAVSGIFGGAKKKATAVAHQAIGVKTQLYKRFKPET